MHTRGTGDRVALQPGISRGSPADCPAPTDRPPPSDSAPENGPRALERSYHCHVYRLPPKRLVTGRDPATADYLGRVTDREILACAQARAASDLGAQVRAAAEHLEAAHLDPAACPALEDVIRARWGAGRYRATVIRLEPGGERTTLRTGAIELAPLEGAAALELEIRQLEARALEQHGADPRKVRRALDLLRLAIAEATDRRRRARELAQTREIVAEPEGASEEHP